MQIALDHLPHGRAALGQRLLLVPELLQVVRHLAGHRLADHQRRLRSDAGHAAPSCAPAGDRRAPSAGMAATTSAALRYALTRCVSDRTRSSRKPISRSADTGFTDPHLALFSPARTARHHYAHPMAATARGINKSLLPSAKTRATIAKRLGAEDRRHDHRHHRRDGGAAPLVPAAGRRAPVLDHPGRPGRHRRLRDLVRRSRPGRRRPPPTCSARPRGSWPGRISLHQTVELVRTTIDVVESQIDEVMPRADRPILHAAIVPVQPGGGVRRGRDLRPRRRAARLLGRPPGGVGGRRRAPRRDRRDRAVPGLDAGLDLHDHAWSWWSAVRRRRTRTPSWRRSGTPPRSPGSTCSAPSRATG